MRRMILLLAGVLLSVVALGSDSPKEYDDSVQVDELEGTWLPIEANFEGAVSPFGHDLLNLSAGRWKKDYGGLTFSGTYRIDATHKPAYLDLTNLAGVAKGAMFRYIYQRDGDTLRLGCFPSGSGSPKSFDDKKLQIITYKRMK